MAIDTYAKLTAEALDWLDRPDLSTKVQTFVELAERDLARRLNLVDSENLIRLDLIAGRAPLPNDYAAWRSLSGPQGYALEFAPPHTFLAAYGRSYGLSATGQGDGYDMVADGSFGGRASWFTIIGSLPLDDVSADISIWPNGLDRPFLLTGPAGAGQVTLLYRQGLPALTPQKATNWLLQAAPDLYLNAVLMQGKLYEKNRQAAADLGAIIEGQVADVLALDREARWGRSRIRSVEATP